MPDIVVLVDRFVQLVSNVLEVMAAVIVASGALKAFFAVLISPRRHVSEVGFYGRVRIDLLRKLVLALEFELGADILQLAIDPTWNRIGIVAAIIVLRTVLDFVLEREIKRLQEELRET